MMSVFMAVSGTRKYLEARTMVTHLLRTQPNRAEIVCRGQKGTFGEAVALAMKNAAMLRSSDLTLVVMATKPSYDAQVPLIKAYWKGLFGRGKMAAGLSLGGIVLAFASTASPILHVLLGIVSGAAGVYVFMMKADAERGLI